VANPAGEPLGAVVEALPNQTNVTPSVIVRSNDGTLHVIPAKQLEPSGDAFVFQEPRRQSDDPAAQESAFEIRSMTMMMILQTGDMELANDASELEYAVDGDTLRLKGVMESKQRLQTLLELTAEICDYQIAPQVTIRKTS